MMKTLTLNPFIYYRIYLDELHMFDKKNKQVYKFNSSAADMIDIIGKNPGIGFEDFLKSFAEMYDAPIEMLPLKCTMIADDAKDFITLLLKNDILENEEVLPSPEKIEIIEGETPFDERIEVEMNIISGEKKILSKALLELTYRCNERCVHCYAVGSCDTQQELSTEEWFEILDQLAEANVFNITLTGGEVFMRKDFLDIFDYAIKKRFLVDIFSNGIAADDEKIRHIASRYPNSFHVSFYGDTAELHDSITGVKGSFDKTLSTMRKFKELGVSLTIKTVMMKQNSHSYSGICKIAKELDAALQLGCSISQANDGDSTPTNYRITSPEEMRRLLWEREKAFLHEKIEPKDLEASLCGAGFNSISINPSGEIFMCNAMNVKIGDCRKEKIVDVWSSSEVLEDFRNRKLSDIKKCEPCEYRDYCLLCPGMALQETGSLIEPYDEACFIAKLRSELRQ